MSTQKTDQIIRTERQKRADGGRPLDSKSRSLFKKGGSIGVNLTAYARDTHNLTDDDSVTVVTYPDGIWIGVGGGADE